MLQRPPTSRSTALSAEGAFQIACSGPAASRKVASTPGSELSTTTSRKCPGRPAPACNAAREESCRVLCTTISQRGRGGPPPLGDSLEADDQLRGVAAPVDRNHERADVVGRHDLLGLAGHD